MYPKTFKRRESKDRIVHNPNEEQQAIADGYALSDPPKDPPEGPGGDAAQAAVQAAQPHTDPIDPRTGSRSEHPNAPAPEVRPDKKPEVARFPKTFIDEDGEIRVVRNEAEETAALKAGFVLKGDK
jgi:hypothetical protein